MTVGLAGWIETAGLALVRTETRHAMGRVGHGIESPDRTTPSLARRDRKVRHVAVAEFLAGEPDAESIPAVLASHYLDAYRSAGSDSDAGTLAGRAVELERITSVATSLGARRVCERALQLSKEHPVGSVVLSDRSALAACERFLADHRILVEPACGASLAAVYESAPELEGYDTLLVVVCGGATSTIDQIRCWAKECG